MIGGYPYCRKPPYEWQLTIMVHMGFCMFMQQFQEFDPIDGNVFGEEFWSNITFGVFFFLVLSMQLFQGAKNLSASAEPRWTKMDWLVLLTSLPLWRSGPRGSKHVEACRSHPQLQQHGIMGLIRAPCRRDWHKPKNLETCFFFFFFGLTWTLYIC